jgi:hypothetical protein
MDENNELNDDQNLNEQPEPAAFSNPDEAADTSNVLTNLADFDDLDETQFGADVVSESCEIIKNI